MRTLALSLLLATALLGALPGTLRAGDDDTELQRLERRVEMLLDMVAELRVEVRTLRERVANLESGEPILEAAAAEAVPEAIPATPIVPMPIVRWADVSGVYVLDVEDTIEAMVLVETEGVEDEEEIEEIRLGIESMFQETSITLRIEKNGTFFVRLAQSGAEEESTARGTWERDVSHVGERQVLVFTTTHEDGEEQERPDEIVGTWEESKLRLKEEEAGFVMVFRRK